MDDISGFVFTRLDGRLKHQTRKVNLVIGSMVTLRASEDGGERAAKCFVNRVIFEVVAFATLVELVFAGVEDCVEIFCSILLPSAPKILRQNYNVASQFLWVKVSQKLPELPLAIFITSEIDLFVDFRVLYLAS